MTAAEKKSVARRARQYGYQANGEIVSVKCPLCRETVSESSGMWGGTITKRLDRVMVEHLGDTYSDGSPVYKPL